MKIKRTIMTPLVVALLALATGGWLLQRGVEPGRNVYANSRVFNEVLRYVSEGFVDQKDDSELYRMAIDGMLEQLGDPHTGFMPAKEYEDLRITTQGEYGGLGISISKRAGWITVINPLPGTPGERAGLRAGDQIIEVNGETTKSWTEEQAVAKLRGPKGTAVDLKIARFGNDEAMPFRIVRDAIHLKSVPTDYMLEKDIGYVELTVFSESSTDELRAALERLRGQGARAVVLDMRNNSGGLLDQGVAVSDLFLDRGQLVVETKGRVESQNHRMQAVDPDEYPGMPLVVLVGERSASATEIVAGALQDHDRALVLGRTTYGKGSVQTVFKLSDNNWLKLTTAKWYTPSGRSIQRPFSDDHPVEIADPADATASAAHDATTDRPTYKTDAGRVVFGGGGIRPDVIVMPDTLTLAERVFVQLAFSRDNDSKYRETLFAYAVRYNKEHPELKPGFEVTQAMRDEFYAALKQSGLEADRAAYDDARRWIDIQLGAQITVSRWGVAENRKRDNRTDPQVRLALELLRKSKDPKSLFAAATTYDSSNKTAGATRGGTDR